MKARLVAVGKRAPHWVAEGYAEYQKRLSHWLPLELVEVAPGLRGKQRDTARAMQDEGARVLAALPKNAHVVVLDGRGRQHSSEQLAARMEHWRGLGRDLAFLVGGPEGHAADVVTRADEHWSRARGCSGRWGGWRCRTCWCGWCWRSSCPGPARCWRTIPSSGRSGRGVVAIPGCSGRRISHCRVAVLPWPLPLRLPLVLTLP